MDVIWTDLTTCFSSYWPSFRVFFYYSLPSFSLSCRWNCQVRRELYSLPLRELFRFFFIIIASVIDVIPMEWVCVSTSTSASVGGGGGGGGGGGLIWGRLGTRHRNGRRRRLQLKVWKMIGRHQRRGILPPPPPPTPASVAHSSPARGTDWCGAGGGGVGGGDCFKFCRAFISSGHWVLCLLVFFCFAWPEFYRVLPSFWLELTEVLPSCTGLFWSFYLLIVSSFGGPSSGVPSFNQILAFKLNCLFVFLNFYRVLSSFLSSGRKVECWQPCRWQASQLSFIDLISTNRGEVGRRQSRAKSNYNSAKTR